MLANTEKLSRNWFSSGRIHWRLKLVGIQNRNCFLKKKLWAALLSPKAYIFHLSPLVFFRCFTVRFLQCSVSDQRKNTNLSLYWIPGAVPIIATVMTKDKDNPHRTVTGQVAPHILASISEGTYQMQNTLLEQE